MGVFVVVLLGRTYPVAVVVQKGRQKEEKAGRELPPPPESRVVIGNALLINNTHVNIM